MGAFERDGRHVRQGLATADDFRFVRSWWEVATASESELRERWPGFSKGGAFSPFYADIHLRVNWEHEGREISNFCVPGTTKIASRPQSTEFYGRPGLTWPLRTHRFCPQVMPAGVVISVRGSGIYADDPLSVLGLFSSAFIDYLLRMQAGKDAHPQYDMGDIKLLPFEVLPEHLNTEFARLGRRGWSLRRQLDIGNETSHAFLLPPYLNQRVVSFDRSTIEREISAVQSQLNELTFALYDIGSEDRSIIEGAAEQRGPIVDSVAQDEANFEDDDSSAETDDADEPVESDAELLRSWLVGVSFGRFDLRLATGERAIPPEPEPFEPLPSRSPGMYPEGEEPADRPDILVDDEGHADDLAASAIAVAERVKVDAPENLRAWLAREFFPLHIKMYSKSRRKAPIYWQLATPSASYSVWLYIHAFSKDTLFRVQNDYLGGERGKLAHEERRLESLTNELRDGATAAQRKQLAAQEAVVDELRAFLDEVKRVAPLWKPNLDDGVIINFAPLWRLVPQNKSWQKELKSTWEALCEGKYDWAHLAMHLWPERVVPKCAKDRSLAIAHGLEDVFWVEGTDGKWTARKTPTRSVDELVRERTSPAVKSALKSLLEAPAAAGKGGGRRGGGRRKSAAAAEGGDA